MIGNVYQAPIKMKDLNPAEANRTTEQTANLNTSVNKFKVYGNLPASVTIDDKKQFTNFTITLDAEDDGSTGLKKVDGAQKYTLGKDGGSIAYAPYGLYYYGFAGDGTNKIKVGDTKEAMAPIETNTAIGSKKYVALEGVDYAVGVLAAAVFNGDKSTNYISTQPNGENPTSPVTDTDVQISGIVINGQSKTLDQDFTLNTSETVSVYEEVADGKGAFSESPLSQTDAKNGNLYVVVAATGTTDNVGSTVTGNLEFTLAKGKYIKTANGVIGNADNPVKFYLPFTLKTADGKAVFMKDYSTILNATVKSWGLASDKPEKVTDATIAVTVDMTWKEGITYDETI